MDINTPGAVPRQRTFASQAVHATSSFGSSAAPCSTVNGGGALSSSSSISRRGTQAYRVKKMRAVGELDGSYKRRAEGRRGNGWKTRCMRSVIKSTRAGCWGQSWEAKPERRVNGKICEKLERRVKTDRGSSMRLNFSPTTCMHE